MSENIPDFLKPYPMPSYLTKKENQQCCCGAKEDYMAFLISEYGAERVLEVERENRKSEEFWKRLSENFRENIERLRNKTQAD